MKKIVKNISTVIILLGLSPILLKGQVSQTQMQRDIRVASGILETLSQSDDRFMMYGDNVTGEYIEGYGVMFSVGGGYSFVAPRVRGINVGRSGKVVVWSGDGDSSEARATVEDHEERSTATHDSIKEVMTVFLTDYSQLIGQLKPTDKIVVSTKKSDYFYYFNGKDKESGSSSAGGNRGMTAELLKKDHDNYLAGKLSKDQLIQKIHFIEHSGENERSKDLDLFSSMIKTLYDVEYTDTYFVSWKPDYERIQGVGAVYSFKVFSSYDENGLYRMPGINKEGLTEYQRSENVIAMYPEFVEGFKKNLIQYGRSINSLDDDEMIMIRITMTKCDNCNIPKKIQFTVRQSVLKDFNTGKLKLSNAVALVKFSEL
jgi:hypothetical protein